MRAAGVGALLALAALPCPALAGPPGKWTRVTTPGADVSDVMRPGLARTPDGVLHVSWTRREAGPADSVVHSAISANAKTVRGPDLIVSAPGGANPQSVLVGNGGGLRAFFAGAGSFGGALATAVSTDGGRSWVLQPTPASRGGNGARPVYAASGIAAALGPAGTVFSAWGAPDPSGAGFHVGISQADPDGTFGAGSLIDPGVGVDSQTGAAFVAMSRLDEGGTAVFPISPAGPSYAIPSSDATQLQHPTHVTGRIGAPGVYVAYTRGASEFLGRAALWDVAAGRGRVVGRRGDEDVSVAAGPAGRLWMFWRAGDAVSATRSNPAATRFGRIVTVPNPKRAGMAHDLTGNGSRGPLDVLLQAGSGGRAATWHQRVLPGLTLRATVADGRAVLRVTDAGDPVKGAVVEVRNEGSKLTSRAGTAVFGLRDGRYSATASKRGFAGASLRVRVR